MKKSILFTTILVVICLFAGCEQEVVNPNESNTTSIVLSGAFSVSENQQVRFSRGNLQYTFPSEKNTKGTWSFAVHQYDFIGTNNVEGTNIVCDDLYSKSGDALANTIDLFGWSGNTATIAKWGISTSYDYDDYSGSFKDWGQNIDNGNTWRTLTYDEWYYLCYIRPNAQSLIGVAVINTGNGTCAYGLVIMPDNWQAPDNIAFDTYKLTVHGIYQALAPSQWQTLENAGAVFLPAAGYREETTVIESFAEYLGFYWSATTDDIESAYALCFQSEDEGTYPIEGVSRWAGISVRLVQDL